jgi:Flavodoxin
LAFCIIWYHKIKMKLTTTSASLLVAAAIITTVDAFAPLLSRSLGNGAASWSSSALFAKVGIWYSSSTGNTDTVARYISKAAGVDDFNDIGDAKNEEIESADALIVGAPTWHTGADKERSGTSWDDW